MSKSTAARALPATRGAAPKSGKKAASGKKAKPASHDPTTPEALKDFMLKDWKAPARKAPPRVKHAEAFAARRAALSKLFPAETLIVPTGHEKVRSNDTYYRFRPASDFYYLTGNLEPDCVLVMTPAKGGGHRSILFVEPNPGRSDATFFTDRAKGELWVGPRLGVEQSRVRYGVDECRPIGELAELVASLRGKVTYPTRLLRGHDATVDKRVPKRARDKQLAEALSEMRLLKDKAEIVELEAVVDATKRGFEDVIRSLKGAKSEREVEGVFNLRARVEGNDVGYGTIAAAGANACILHWTRNDGVLKLGDLLLLDAGVEGRSLYTADITRTLPISGKFSPEQRVVYELVHRAQTAAIEAVKVGNDFMEPNRVAMRILADGLHELGILRVSPEEALKEEHQFYRRYSLHNVSHMLGIDVHDCAKARKEVYKFGQLRPGMVLTVEPGLYFQRDDLTVPARFRGIGVRIEDDILVTARGPRNLSAHIPSELREVEAWMAEIWRKARAR
jgi:Xaa-Pro aminopeptidase